MQCVILQPKNTTRNANIPPTVVGVPTAKDIGAILRRATAPESVGVWKWGSTMIHLFGYKTGKAGTENKHELPPPHDTILLFGEAVLVATTGAASQPQLATFTTTQYTTFFNEAMGGFEDLDSEDSDEDIESEVGSVVEEEEEVAEESEEEESEEELVIDEEEEEAPPPPKITRIKRTTKKTPTWYTITELVAESYEDSVQDLHPQRVMANNRIQCLLKGTLSESDQQTLERGIFNFTIEEAKRKRTRAVWENPEFQTLYDIQVRRVLSNLATTSYITNVRLLTRFQEGEFKIWELPYMMYSDLYPENWLTLTDKEMKKEAKMLEVDTSMATDMFRCSRCGKRQCTYYEQQTRSADEPMTIFIRCVNCGKQWRQ